MRRPTEPLLLDRWVHTMNDAIERLVTPHGSELLQAANLTRGVLEVAEATGLDLDRSRALLLSQLDQRLALMAETAPVVATQILELTGRVEAESLRVAAQVLALVNRAEFDPID